MKPKDADAQKSFWKECVYFVCTVIPSIFGRILVSPSSSFITSNEKLEYILGMFLGGTTGLLVLLLVIKWTRPEIKKDIRWYFGLYPITIPFTIIWIWLWIKALVELIELF